MVFTPHRGDLPLRHGPGVQGLPDIGPSVLDRRVYTDPERYEQERAKIFRRSWQIVARSEQLPTAGDHLVWEGHGETVVVTRRPDGGLSGFHNVCQHRGARIVKESGHGARRFTCRWHGWSYDADGVVTGVPARPEFDEARLTGLCAPPVACDEWGGWVWILLDGPGSAPPLLDWIGPEIAADLGAYEMQNMKLVETLTWELPVNWKVVIDGFNEVYHAMSLHHVPTQDVKDGKESTFFVFGRNAMMVVPFKGVLPELLETRDHQGTAICHYTVFPTAVFNNNPNHLQLFRPVPLAVDRTRFEVWELWYDTDDQDYLEAVGRHWEHLKEVVAEDVEIFCEVGATKDSSGYTANMFGERECKLTAFHATCQEMIDS